MQAPGNDLVAASALAASDCQLVLFTTGRGTPFGSFVPTVKVATNNDLFAKKGHWMDFNAGPLLETPMADVLEEFITYIIDVASGQKHGMSRMKCVSWLFSKQALPCRTYSNPFKGRSYSCS